MKWHSQKTHEHVRQAGTRVSAPEILPIPMVLFGLRKRVAMGEVSAMMFAPYGYGPGGGWMVGGWIIMIAFWGLVIFGIVALIRVLSDRGASGRPSSPETPMDILRRRYAAGELTKEQFEEMKRDLA